MTVKELIKVLEGMNGDLPVEFRNEKWELDPIAFARVSYIRRKVILERELN